MKRRPFTRCSERRPTTWMRGTIAVKHTFRLIIGLTFLLPVSVEAQDAAQLLQRAALSRAKGHEAAPVLVYEVADFQCPFCSRFARDVFPKIDSAYVKTGKVQWVFVNLPLPNHPHAWVAAEAALCAGATVNNFWTLHDRLFNSQQEWSASPDAQALFVKYAREAGVSAADFESCIRDDRVAALILQDVIFAASTRVTGTPAFIINNETRVTGVKTWEEWRDLLEQALARKAAK